MTQLLCLLNQVFALNGSRDLERYITAQQPSNEKEVETLAHDYLYHYTSLRGM